MFSNFLLSIFHFREFPFNKDYLHFWSSFNLFWFIYQFSGIFIILAILSSLEIFWVSIRTFEYLFQNSRFDEVTKFYRISKFDEISKWFYHPENSKDEQFFIFYFFFIFLNFTIFIISKFSKIHFKILKIWRILHYKSV